MINYQHFPDVKLPIVSIDEPVREQVVQYLRDTLYGGQWCSSIHVTAAIILSSRLRGSTAIQCYPMTEVECLYLYNAFQEYAWLHMPEELRSKLQDKAWFYVCHDFVAPKEILEMYNGAKNQSYQFNKESHPEIWELYEDDPRKF